jgi:UDP-N-acetylmuramyl pentapeptide synthase
LKCPDNVPDKAAFFHKELAKLTKDMEIEEPQMPEGEFLLNEDNVKVRFAAKEGRVVAWLTFEIKEKYDIRRELYTLTSKIDKCFAINEASVCPQK